MQRRSLLLACGAALSLPARPAPGDELEPALRRAQAIGGVLMLRHALAPGTFDPPGFKLGDCSSQRNLNDEGRAQARQLGAWFSANRLRPSLVRSSPWCRCLETATLAFGTAAAWPPLGSPTGQSAVARSAQQQALRAALQAASAWRGGFEVWVTHMFVMNDLAQVSLAPGEGLVLRVDPAGAPQVLARIMAL